MHQPRRAQDHYDVKMPCHMLLAKLAAAAGEAVLAHLERLVPPLEATLATKIKTDAVKQAARPRSCRALAFMPPHLTTACAHAAAWTACTSQASAHAG